MVPEGFQELTPDQVLYCRELAAQRRERWKMSAQALAVANWHADKACNAYAKAQYFTRKERWKDYEASLMVYARHLKIADLLRVQ